MIRCLFSVDVYYLDETLVKREIVPDGVLPALPVGGVVGEGCHDPGVDLCQGHPPAGAGLDGHGDQGNVGVGRLLAPAGGPHEEGSVERGEGGVGLVEQG